MKRLWIIAVIALLPLSARAEDKKAERTWKAKCASCHGADGKGQTEQGKKVGISDLTAPAWQKEHTAASIEKAISDGVSRTKDGKLQEMEPYKGKLDPAQISALAAYVQSLK